MPEGMSRNGGGREEHVVQNHMTDLSRHAIHVLPEANCADPFVAETDTSCVSNAVLAENLNAGKMYLFSSGSAEGELMDWTESWVRMWSQSPLLE